MYEKNKFILYKTNHIIKFIVLYNFFFFFFEKVEHMENILDALQFTIKDQKKSGIKQGKKEEVTMLWEETKRRPTTVDKDVNHLTPKTKGPYPTSYIYKYKSQS